MWKYTLRYQYGTYAGNWTVRENEEEDSATVIARMWSEMRQRGMLTLPMAYKSAKVVDKKYIPDDYDE